MDYLVNVIKRKANPKDEETSDQRGKRVHRSLRDDPKPIVTPGLRKQKENQLRGTSRPVKKPTTQLHPSIMAQPRIEKEKRIEKELRDKERANTSTSVENNKNSIVNIINEETSQEGNNSKQTLNKLIQEKSSEKSTEIMPTRIPRRIQMQTDCDSYDVIKDLNSSNCNITFGQLLDVAPKIRSQVSQGLKLEKNNTKISGAVDNMCATTIITNNIDHTYKSKHHEPQEDDIAMVDVIVDGVRGKALIDSCSNLSIITKQFLDKLPYQYEPIGVSAGRIRLATMNDDYSEDVLIKVPVKINELELLVTCRIIDKEDPFYDILINLKTQIDNQLFIHPIRYSLCRFNDQGLIEEIAPINNEYDDEEKLLCVIKALNHQEAKQQLKTIEGLPPIKYIYDTVFQSTINSNYREAITKLLEEYIDIIATSSEELTPSDLSPHKIILKEGVKPIKQKFYRLSKLKTDILKEELTKLIYKRLIEPSCSEWSSPVVLVPKKNGKWRLCIDYRKVNEATKKDSYSLPNIEEIFDSLDGAKIFSTLDLYSGYHQILMDDDSVEITTFTTKFGNYQFKVMPFGLTGAPATFQREMNRILFPLIGKCVYNFIDDILIYSRTEEEHLEHLKQVLEIFKEHKLKINIEKCSFMQTEVEVLGHKVSSEGLSPLENKVEAIKEWKAPSNIHELRSFLGAIGYYRNFIKDFAKVTAPLCTLLRKGIKFEWKKEQEESFKILKERLINAPILRFPRFDREFIIRTDASYDGIGGVLLQKDDETGKEHPVHYISRSLSKSEKNYGITDLEGAALIYCINKLKSYIMGNPKQTIVYTDHRPLIGLLKSKEPQNSRHTRWCLTVSMLGIDLRYETGKNNVVADALSRMKNEKEKVVLTTQIIKEQDENLLSRTIKEFIEEKFTTIDGVDYFVDGNNYRKLVTDTKEKLQLIFQAHSIGHEGYYKTYQRLKKSYYWNNMVNDIKRIIGKCEKCQLNKSQPYPEPTEDKPTEVEGPFTHLGLDIIGPLSKTRNNNQYIIVVVDYFTKWVEAEPTENVTSQDVIKFLINVFARHGVPQIITTDNGTQFTSDMTKIFLDLYDVYVKFITPYHPESNGLVENRNKEIGKLLRLLGQQHKEWDEILPYNWNFPIFFKYY